MNDEIEQWLEGLGLGQYAEVLASNDIDFRALPYISDQDLKELGVSLGHRRILLAAIADLAHEDWAQPAETKESEPAPEAERRQVTILFADLCGYTRLSTEVDAEEAHTILGGFFEHADSIVYDHGGTVDKHIGDSVMAVFGAPVAHGNDPERAVRAALAIRDAMPGLSEEVGRSLEVHVGIASGQVVASGVGSDAHYTVTGESVNLASRLTDVAAPGEVLISGALLQTVAELVLLGDRGEIPVKGLAEPVRTYALLGLRAEDEVRAGHPFVARRAELQQFTGALDACSDTGAGQAVYIRGEAGIGKTRLVEEFQRLAEDRNFACHRALVLDFGVATGQDPIRSLVRSLLGIRPEGGKAERSEAAQRVFAEGLLGQQRAVHLNDLLDLPQPMEFQSLYDAMDNAMRNRGKRETVADLVTALGGRGPLMLVVEDLHWADTLTLEHLAELTRTVADGPALLVMSSRVEGDPLGQAWRSSTGGAPLMTIDLGPLRRRDAIALAAEYVDATTRFALSCVERAEGNPLFLEQLLRGAEETRDEQVPASVQSIVQARLDNLEPQDKRAIQAASVLGQRFSLEALRQLLARPQYTCARPIEHYLVRPEGADFLFAHALVQEGVYGSLLKTRRTELHRRAADWYAGRDPALRAEHLDRAEDPGAAAAYLEAAETQAAAYHQERALALAERGLALAEARPDRFTLTCFRGQVLHDLGRIPESIEAYEQGRDLADDEAEKSRAWLGLAAGMRMQDRYDEALAALDQAEAAARAKNLVPDLGRIYSARGNIHFPLGNIDGCLEQHQIALDYMRKVSSPEDEARAQGGLGDAYYQRGRMLTAHDHYHRCVELCRENGLGRIEVAHLHMRGLTHYYQNNLESALEDCRTAADAAAKVGRYRAETVARGNAGNVLLDMGNLVAAQEQSEQALTLARRIGVRRFEATSLSRVGMLMAQRGQRHEAVKIVKEALSISRETGITFAGPWILGILAVATEDPIARRQALDEGVEILRQSCVGHCYLWFYRHAMEASRDSGDWDGVDRYAEALEEYTRPEPLPSSDFVIARGRALADFGRGKRDEATLDELRRLRDEADRVGLKLTVRDLETTIAEA